MDSIKKRIFVMTIKAIFAFRRLFLSRFKSLCKRLINQIHAQGTALTTQQKHNLLIRQVANDLDLEVTELPREFLRIKKYDKTIFCQGNDFSVESVIAFRMSGDKRITSTLLSESGLQVPGFKTFSIEGYWQAQEFFGSLNQPCVVKPAYGTARGDGVTVKIYNSHQFRHAFIRALYYCPTVMVEEYIEGRHLRIALLDGELVFAMERFPAQVKGDGSNSVRKLIDLKNSTIKQQRGLPTAYPVRIDREVRSTLKRNGLQLADIPEAGETVLLRDICNASLGGEAHDLTDSLDENWLSTARKATEQLGAHLAGVDLIIATSDSGRESLYINEVNTTPGLLLPSFDPATPDGAFKYLTLLLQKLI